MVLDVLELQLHKMVVEDEDKEEDQPIGNMVSQLDSVTATAATAKTAAACISSLKFRYTQVSSGKLRKIQVNSGKCR